jgi:CheY-like chemotaxis protein
MTSILLVENEKNQRLLYEQELKFEDYEILTAADGEEALEKVQEQTPDIIIMDIGMPKMDGLETIGRIISQHKGIPIIIYTAYSSYKDNFMSWLADAYIIKSSDLTELKNKIKEVITNKSQRLQRKVSMHNGTEKNKHERIRPEKRKYRRIEKPFMARFRVKQFEAVYTPVTNWETVTLKDISAGGTLFNYKKNLGLNSLLDLKIDDSTSKSTINYVGEIIRIEESKPESVFRIATEFKEIDEQKKEKLNTIVREVLVQEN